MKKEFKIKSLNLKVVMFFCALFTFHFSLFTASDAKVYIDITSPALRKLPISINYTGPAEAGQIAGIAEDDLNFTGIFYFIDPDIAGAEIRVRINVEVLEEIKADVEVFDLIANRTVLNKRYRADRKYLRALAHGIANDVFEVVTGRKGVFRTKLAYIVNSGNKKWLYLTDWDGYNPVRIVSKGLSASHSWSPDARYFIYSSERNRKWNIYSLDLKSYREKVLFSSKGLNLVGGISPDNRVAFSSSRDGSLEIYVMNINGTGIKKLTRSYGIDVSPVFSPDGSRIAFVSDRGGSPQIYVMNSNGRGVKRVTFEGPYNTSPAWSPDGKWIAYVGRKNGKNQVFMIKSDSTDLRQLTSTGNNENPSFSPDGMFISFDSDRGGNKNIYLMSINGERERRITPRKIKAMNPRWSPYLKK
ncbi:MAG TPA: hypothetical protein ENG75_02465 [Nitrospirae bacterium]|nr:translocation protein TolB [bacterium BMS3Bbin08]HDK16790.1 hypothetical protein [Nitrospirota bacterium]